MCADICDSKQVELACNGAEVVFHCASLLRFWTNHMYTPASEISLVYKVNVQGTEHVIEACQKCAVKRLIYTSTCNVVLDGENHVERGTELLPYPKQYMDVYSASKAMAEQLVLQANSKQLACSVIRPVGIYGPGEQTHFNRALSSIKYLPIPILPMFGSASILTDWIHVDNLVHAHALLEQKMQQGQCHGQVYTVSDGEWISCMDLFIPAINRVSGKEYKVVWVPAWIGMRLSQVTEVLFCVLRWLLHLIMMVWTVVCSVAVCCCKKPKQQQQQQTIVYLYPLLTQIEIFKLAYHNYFCIDKARKELGYAPLVTFKQGLQQTIDYLVQENCK